MTNAITLINHASLLIQLGELNILTDPVYSWTIAFLFPRLQKAGIPFRDLPPINTILVSHTDYDHLNLRTLRRLRQRSDTDIVVPTRVGPYCTMAGFSNVVELDPWQSFNKPGIRITSVPAKHVSKRKPGDPATNACAGFVVEANGRTVYFSGDTAYADFFRDIGTRFRIDVALLPIGAYKPEKWFKNLHLHPATALQAFEDLNAGHMVPFHWGTFWISDEPMSEPPAMLRAEAERRGLLSRVHILRNGERFEF